MSELLHPYDTLVTQKKLLGGEIIHPSVFLDERVFKFANIRTTTSILHLTDTHFGKWGVHSCLPVKKQSALVERITQIAEEPASGISAVCFTGDLSSGIGWLPWYKSPDKGMLQEIVAPLKRLTNIPKFATYGNHDFYMDPDIPYDVLDDCGFTILSTESKQPFIAPLTEDISIWGMPDFMMQQEAHAEMCRNMAYMYQGIHPNHLPIVMAHNPDTFDYLPADMHYLGLAGHTHGAAYTNKYLRDTAVRLLNSQNKDLMQGTFENGEPMKKLHISRGAGRHVGTPFSDVEMEVTKVTVCPADQPAQ